MPPPPPTPPAVSVNPRVEGDGVMSTYRSPSNIKAKTIPQLTMDELQTGRAIKKLSLPPAPPTAVVDSTPAGGDETISTYRSPGNIEAKTTPQSTKDELPARRTVKTLPPPESPTRPAAAVHPTPAEGDEAVSTYRYQRNIEETTMTQLTEDVLPIRRAIKTPSPSKSPARPAVAVHPTPAREGDEFMSTHHYQSNIEEKEMSQSTEYESPIGDTVKMLSPPPSPAPPTAVVTPTLAKADKVMSTYSDRYLSSIEAETMPQLTQNEPPTGHVKTPSPPPAPPTKATTPEPQILPALSRIPYLPFQTLTDAELDMTVEEWIRYQMEIEYDKLKRDGERELTRFKARAEEARKIIESL